MVGAVARLVAERPHDHARVVAVTLDHPRPSRQPRRPVPGVVAQAGVVGVALDVGFVDDVHADLVAEVEEARVVRIVRTTHGGDVVAPHGEQVVAHVVDGDCLAPYRMMVVTVHPEDPDRLAVDEQLPIADLDAAEPDQLLMDLDDRPGGIDQFGDHAVARRRLGRPRIDVGDLEVRRCPMTTEPIGGRERVGHSARHRAGDPATPQCLEPEAHLPTGGWGLHASDGRTHLEGAGRVAQPGIADQRRQIYRCPRLEVHLTVQTGHPPLVLVFHVAVGAPADHDDRHIVQPGPHEGGHVVLARQSAVGAVPDEPTVDVDRVHALCTADVDDDLATAPPCRHRHLASVDARRIPVGQPRRRAIERHLYVRVLRMVVDALQRPVARHVHLRP